MNSRKDISDVQKSDDLIESIDNKPNKKLIAQCIETKRKVGVVCNSLEKFCEITRKHLNLQYQEFTVLDGDEVEVLDEDYFSEIKSGTVMQIRKQIKTKQLVSKENDNDEDIEINHTNNLPRLQICLPGDLIKHDDLVKVMGKVDVDEFADIGFMISYNETNIVVKDTTVLEIKRDSLVIVHGYYITNGGNFNEDVLVAEQIEEVTSKDQEKAFLLERLLSHSNEEK